MIRAYDDNGNVVNLVEWEKQVRADAIKPIKAILEEGYTMMWGERKTLEKIREYLKEQKNE